MDFFEQQTMAKRRTGRLVLLFIAAVLAMTLLVWLLVLAAWTMALPQVTGSMRASSVPWLEALLGSVAGVGAVVGGGSLMKMTQLAAGGGAVVATSLGGQPVAQDTRDAAERRLLNVVEEMSIASGVPMPKVYMLQDEAGINAFAAGYRAESAVIGVTRGCVESLTRDELQGVVAHEFSHILNGDMRLNIRMIGIIFGIFALSVIGRVLVRSVSSAKRSTSRKNKNGSGGAVVAMLLIGVALIAIGSLGVLFGKLIQAAVSRQREFLADASAVQFTRQRDGIANALRRIGGAAHGSSVDTPHAVETAHLFFGSATSKATAHAASAFATHPPLDVRIRAIDPAWDGTWLQGPASHASHDTSRAAHFASPPRPPGVEERLTQQIGKPTPAHVTYAQQVIASLPAAVRTALQQPTGAQAVVWALLLGKDEATAMQRTEKLAKQHGTAGALTASLWPHTRTIERTAYLPMLDLAVPALVQLGEADFNAFWHTAQQLVTADGQLDLFEWMLGHLLRRHVMGALRPGRTPDPTRSLTHPQATAALAVVLPALARAGARSDEEQSRVLQHAVAALGPLPGLKLVPVQTLDVPAIDAALHQLNNLRIADKRHVLDACAACVSLDHQVTLAEGELLRVVSDAMGIPVPPMLAGQRL